MKKLVFVILFLNLIFQSIYSQVVNGVLALENSIEALSVPSHIDTFLTADSSYNGVFASGTVSLYKSKVTSDVRNPVIFLEGLDLENIRFADGIFELLRGKIDPVFTKLGWTNGPDIAQCLLNNGYDIIIVNYTNARTYIQANAMLVVKVIQHVNNELKAGKNSNILVGASMGGLVGRYALSYMEANLETTGDHETRLFISYDSPQRGGNIPLGDQYWIKFWADEGGQKSAKDKLKLLDDIAPRQLLVYHHSVKVYPYEHSDRSTLVSELNSLGYPQTCRTVAITNGSANGKGLDFGPGDKIVSYEHEYWHWVSGLVLFPIKISLHGYAYAVQNKTSDKIADCAIVIDGIVKADSKPKVVNTLPYDNAPGGMRATNKEIADIEPSVGGNIKTENPNHCFIPTISALDINTSDLFYNIQDDPDILSKTPFDAIYYPINNASINQPHVYITSEIVNWILNELVPDIIVLDGTTKNVGDVVAKKSITFLPGFQADETSKLHATLGTYTTCDVSVIK